MPRYHYMQTLKQNSSMKLTSTKATRDSENESEENLKNTEKVSTVGKKRKTANLIAPKAPKTKRRSTRISLQKKAKKMDSENFPENDEIFAENDENFTENAENLAENDENRAENDEIFAENDENFAEIQENQDETNESNGEIENNKNIIEINESENSNDNEDVNENNKDQVNDENDLKETQNDKIAKNDSENEKLSENEKFSENEPQNDSENEKFAENDSENEAENEKFDKNNSENEKFSENEPKNDSENEKFAENDSENEKFSENDAEKEKLSKNDSENENEPKRAPEKSSDAEPDKPQNNEKKPISSLFDDESIENSAAETFKTVSTSFSTFPTASTAANDGDAEIDEPPQNHPQPPAPNQKEPPRGPFINPLRYFSPSTASDQKVNETPRGPNLSYGANYGETSQKMGKPEKTENAQKMGFSGQNTTFQSQNFARPPGNPFEAMVEQIGPSQFKAEIEVPESVYGEGGLNFVGMMIGPRGYTQRQMEASTGCNIIVKCPMPQNPREPKGPMSVELKSNSRASLLNGAALVYELIHNKAKRDILRQQQIAMRSQALNAAPAPMAQCYAPSYAAQAYSGAAMAQNYAPRAQMPPQQPSAAYGAATHGRTPFQNAFSSRELGGGSFLESVVVPSTKVAMITGGNNFIAELEAVSGAAVSVSANPQASHFSEISFRGSKPQIAVARGRLQALFESDPSEETNGPPSDYAMIANTVVGIIIGKNGETIKKFMGESGCRMKVTPEYLTNPDELERKVLLYGNPKQCADAKRLVSELVRKHKTTNYTTLNFNQTKPVIISVPCGIIGILIGRGGETIRSMCTRTNCRVQVVQYDSNQLFPGGVIQNEVLRHVSMQGDETAIKKAQVEIQAIVNEHAYRNNYDPPRVDHDHGDAHLGLAPEQHQLYLDQMRAVYGLDRAQVHAYHQAFLAEAGREPSDYASRVQAYLRQQTQPQQTQQSQIQPQQSQIQPSAAFAQGGAQPYSQQQTQQQPYSQQSGAWGQQSAAWGQGPQYSQYGAGGGR